MSQANEQTTESAELESTDFNNQQVDERPGQPGELSVDSDLGIPEPEASPERRIQQLESALKQCQIYINELKALLSDQEFLESQLASTEEYSHIQQKAIAALRDQLLQQRTHDQDLDILRDQRAALSSQVDYQEKALSELQGQFSEVQQEVTRLQSANRKLDAELQLALVTDVESTQQRIIAQQTNERLRHEIRNLEEQLKVLKDRAIKHDAGQKRYLTIISALKNSHKSDSQKNLAIKNMSSALLMAQDTITKLENELSSQCLMQAQLQQLSHELEENVKANIDRIDAQERQIAEMQEQILHQAQEAREYETAVQHWKDKSEKYESLLGQLFNLLDTLPENPKEIDPGKYAKLIELRDDPL